MVVRSSLGTVCPHEDDIAAFVTGGLTGEARRVIADHIDGCDACRRLVSTLAATELARDADRPSQRATVPGGGELGLAAGDRLGRFTLTRRVGHGAMGEVWAARDPALDREIAIKLLRLGLGGLGGERRLHREARMMARLNHRNVVMIHELGVDGGGRVFCAMELVDGVTLRRWLDTPRTAREVLAVALAAGRGIAAAHAAGVVHRDIKPENILIAHDGRTLVSDLGLARLYAADDVPHDGAGAVAGDAPSAMSARASGAALTATGALIGTPAYMAPEQLVGREATTASDQFSYCVTVYEALCGARPFTGDTLDELARAIDRGPRPPSDLRGTPSAVVRCLMRGLAADPDARWPDLDALLDALEHAARPPRRVRIAGAVTLAVVAITGLAAAALVRAAPTDAERTAAVQQITRAFGPSARPLLAARFVASGSPLADERATAVHRLLDQYRAHWLTERLDAWAATHVRGEQRTELLDARLACLDQLADEMGGLAHLLMSEMTAQEVDRAPAMVLELEPVATCGDIARITAPGATRWRPPRSPEEQAAGRALRALEVLQLAGRHGEAQRQAAQLIDEATRSGEPARIARARFHLGVAQAGTGKLADAQASLRRAIEDAAAARDHALVAEAWLRLLRLTGLDLRRTQDASAIAPAVRAAVAQAGDDPRQRAELERTLGQIAAGAGDFAAARDHFAAARERRIVARGPEHLSVAEDESQLAAVLAQLGRDDEAAGYLRHAIAVIRDQVGPHHPVIARAEAILGAIAARRTGGSASASHDRSAAMPGPPDHPDRRIIDLAAQITGPRVPGSIENQASRSGPADRSSRTGQAGQESSEHHATGMHDSSE